MTLADTSRMVLGGLVLAGLAAGCTHEVADEDDEGAPQTSQAQELNSAVSCTEIAETAYTAGEASRVTVITIGNKKVTRTTGHAFLRMQKAADAAGVPLAINSGFRTMSEQRYFYGCYQSGNCNNGNLAARPGYSNHQSGLALDLTTSSWLVNNAARFGFHRTVPREPWHYEYTGGDPGGPCGGGGAAGGGAGPAADSTCLSQTLGRDVAEKTCVESKFDNEWYQCKSGVWMSGGDKGTGPAGACVTTHPLGGS